MSRSSVTDEQLFELVRGVDPFPDEVEHLPVQSDVLGVDGERLLQQILSNRRGGLDVRHVPRKRRLALGVASGAGLAAVAATIVALTAGGAPSTAFAGWSADPTAPSEGQVRAAESECRRDSALTSLAPVLVDARGPYTLLVYAEGAGSLCVTGPSLHSPTGQPPVVPFGSFLAASTAAAERAASARGESAAPRQPPPIQPAADAITTAAVGGVDSGAGGVPSELGLRVGRVGSGVTAVTLVLKDGRRVQATIANGWFAAWWPGGQAARTAEIVSSNATVTQQLVPSTGYETASKPEPGGSH